MNNATPTVVELSDTDLLALRAMTATALRTQYPPLAAAAFRSVLEETNTEIVARGLGEHRVAFQISIVAPQAVR